MTGEMVAKIEALFADYGARSDAALRDPDTLDVAAVASSFAGYFVGSNPLGVFGGANDDALRAAIPQGFAHYRAVGGKRMAIEKVTVSEIDPLHAMARVAWAFEYTNKAGESGTIRFENVYFVTLAGGEPAIFAYVTPDEQAAMRAHGLV